MVVDFCKNLFAKEIEPGVNLGLNFWEEEDKVTREESEFLIAHFTEFKIKEVVC